MLSLRDNCLVSLPPGIGSLTSLRSLDLRGNHLTALPEALCALTALEDLDVSGNAALGSLPPHWDGMYSLRTVRADGCPRVHLPPALPPALLTLTGAFLNVPTAVSASGSVARVRVSLYASAAIAAAAGPEEAISPAPSPVTLFVTPRLRLRTMCRGDAALVREALNDPPFIANVRDSGVRTLEDAAAYIASGPLASCAALGYGGFIVETLSSGPGDGCTSASPIPIGMAGFYKRPYLDLPDVGYTLLQRHWKRGYAREAVMGLLAYSRDALGFSDALAIISPGNDASRKVAEACGLTWQSRMPLPGPGGGVVDVLHISL